MTSHLHMCDMNPRSVPDNATPYEQGRSDQRRVGWPVIAAILIAVVIFIVWGKR